MRLTRTGQGLTRTITDRVETIQVKRILTENKILVDSSTERRDEGVGISFRQEAYAPGRKLISAQGRAKRDDFADTLAFNYPDIRARIISFRSSS